MNEFEKIKQDAIDQLGIFSLKYFNPPVDEITERLIRLKHCKLLTCNKAFDTGPKSKKYCSDLCRWTAWSKRNPRKTDNPIKETKNENS